MTRRPTCSLIVLAYNEEKNIGACLDAVARQSVMPDEVLVINNNSTDKTVEIASKYSFVKIIYETEQGMIPARNLGFNEATGDILMRIDADTQITTDWVRTVLEEFAKNTYDGVSGIGEALWPRFKGSRILALPFARAYFIVYGALFGAPLLWGANMAITSSAWTKVKNLVCNDSRLVHEDQDISLWMAKVGLRVGFNSDMLVSYDAMNVVYLPNYFKYVRLQYETGRWHRSNNGFNAPKRTLFKRTLVVILLLPVYALYLITCLIISLYVVAKRYFS